MSTEGWILIGVAAVVVLASEFVISRARKKAGKAAEERDNLKRMARGASQDENLADRFKQ